MQFSLKKIALSVAILATVNLSAEASSIIGVEGVYNNTDAQEHVFKQNYNQSSAGVGVRIGGESKNFRFLLIFDSILDQKHEGATVSQYMLTGNLDYFIPIQSQIVKPFIGVVVGEAKYKYSSYSDNGYLYGGEVGIDFKINEHFSADLFGRYTTTEIDDVNHYIQSGIGLNYRFLD